MLISIGGENGWQKKCPDYIKKRKQIEKSKHYFFHIQYILNSSDEFYSLYWYTAQVMEHKSVTRKKMSHLTLITQTFSFNTPD